MTEQVIEQAVAEEPTSSKIATQEVSANTISEAVNGSEPTSSDKNTTAPAVTEVGEDAVVQSANTVTQADEEAVAESPATVEPQKEAVASPAVTEVGEDAVVQSANTQADEGAVAESPATVEPQKEAVASENKQQADKPKRKRRRKKRKKRRGLDTYVVGDELEGVVRSVQPYGAFIDVGAERDGLIHISELREGYVEKVEDVIKEHDKVVIRVKEVNVETGRLSLTMLSPESIEAQKEPKKKRIHLRYLEEGQELVGRVNSIVDFGAFIDIGATTDGLVHISQMSEDHISSVSDFLKEGQEVNVRILTIDKKRKRISLTMREAQIEEEEPEREKKSRKIVEHVEEDDENEEGLPSLMAIAFARANARKQRKDRSSKKNKEKKQSGEIDEIVSRMLDKHRSDQ